MKLVSIVRFFRGSVSFTATGGFPERFINLCNINGIHIWNVEPFINHINATVSAQNFLKLRRIATNSGVKIKITNKNGLPFLARKYRDRAVLPLGLIFFLIFIFVMNQFVWVIDVSGSEKLSREEITEIVMRYGLKPGAFVPTLNEAAVSRNTVNHYDGQIVWMAVNIKGSRAAIEIRDFAEEQEDTTYGSPCNIVADFEGKILSIETYNGDREVTAGNGVKAGDLLISGVIENRDMSCDYLEARGKITALHNVTFSKTYKKTVEYSKRITDTSETTELVIPFINIPFQIKANNKDFSAGFSEHMVCKGIKLPFGIKKTVTCNFSSEQNTQSDFLFALDSYVADYYHRFRNTNILDVNFSVTNKNNLYTISAKSECIDFMGVKKDIYVSD